MTRIKKRFSKITMGYDNLTCRKYILIFTLKTHSIKLDPRVIFKFHSMFKSRIFTFLMGSISPPMA